MGRQLLDMQQFVKRLTLAGLLTYPQTLHNDKVGRSNCRIKWTQVNHHDITNAIITVIIPQLYSCSWVEFVSKGLPQERRFFCSHNWAEPFRDFMATIGR